MFTIPKTYQLVKEFDLCDIHSAGFLLEHIKTGARISLITNDDDNKVFYVAFRTPPEDSTGVAHIIEHSVLCGSKKYPIKDPFVELAKGSLNTFLNAMTYPDKTVYPVASTNDKDFANLMDVYMDAVFYPNIYENKKIFLQEGWHYELDSSEGELTLNGVVYNEMKGAFSSPDDVLERETFNSLFPDTAYGVESGGDPKVIPQLTYENFLKFHKRYYHPSNAYIYLYGDCDMTERLEYLDREYLSKFDRINPDSQIQEQPSFEKTVSIEKNYPIAEGEDAADKTYMSLNYVVGTVLDPVLYQAMDILDYALLNAPGAPIRKALLDADIGKDILGGYNNGILQPMFTVALKGSNKENLEEFLDIIEKTLQEQAKNGIDEKSILAGINSMQFMFREADFGGYPKGLLYGLMNLDSWLYSDKQPFLHLQTIQILDELKDKIGSGYFEDLIRTYFLDNHHASIVVVEPEVGLTKKQEEEQRLSLQNYKASLSDEEREQIIKEASELLQFQDEPTPQEDLCKLPLLERLDLRKEARPLCNRLEEVDKIKVLYHDIETNGIHYLKFLFDADVVPKRLLPTLGLMTRMLGLLDTQNYAYADFANEVNLITGGIYAALTANTCKDHTIKTYFSVSAKFLEEHTEDAFSLFQEMLLRTKWEDKKRMKELLFQEISSFQNKMMSSGHSVALQRASAQFSPTAAFYEMTAGIDYYHYLKEFENQFDEKIETFIQDVKSLLSMLLTTQGCLVSSTGTKELTKVDEQLIAKIKPELREKQEEPKREAFVITGGNEAFKTASQIQYVCRAGNFKKGDYSYHGALQVLRTIMSYEYLWVNVRVKGGAYGCMSNFQRSGDAYFVSYRDPNLKETISVFENAANFIASFDVDERDMTKYVIGTVSTMDTPLTPAQEGERSLGIYILGLDYDQLQKSRDEVLQADVEDIRNLAPLIAECMKQNHLCVLGNETMIEQASDLFDQIETLS